MFLAPWHRLALVVGRQIHGDDVVIPVLFVIERDLGRDRAVQVHDQLLGVERVVVVGIAPAQGTRRHVAFLVGRREVGDALDHGLPDLRIVEVRAAVGRDDAPAAVGKHEMVEQRVAVGRPGGGDLQSQRIDAALALLAQLLLHRLEEVEIGVPGFRCVRQFEARLLDQRVPHVHRRHGGLVGREVEGPPLFHVVVVLRGEQGRRVIVGPLRLDDVGHVDRAVDPGVLRQHPGLGAIIGYQVGDVAAGQRRDHLLGQRTEGNDGVVEPVAARLLVVRDDPLEGAVLLLDEALRPPQDRGLRLGIGNIGAGWRSRRCKSQGAAKRRAPGHLRHAEPPLPSVGAARSQRFPCLDLIS